MKYSAIFLIAFTFFSVSIFAQRTAKNQSNTPAPSKVSLVNLITETNSSFVISSDHISSISGVHHYYLRQAINGMEVQGTESSVHIAANGQTVAEHNRFLDNITATVKNSAASLTGESNTICGNTNGLYYYRPYTNKK
jgi:Zn-dependent metalloprotease